MLIVKNLKKSFPKVVAVDDLSFEIEPGQVCGFVGPNGAGKTTTMRIIATLEIPDKGNVLIDGKSIYDDPYAARKKLGFMPDVLGIYPDMTVEEYLQFFARLYEIAPKQRDQRVEEIMIFTELNKIKEKLIDTLSRGMRQRLNLGRALVNNPKLLIMDEPAGGLDPRARVELRYMIKKLAELGKTIFISSHILSELSEICDHILIIEKGKMITSGKIAEIRKQLQDSCEIRVKLVKKEQVNEIKTTLIQMEHIENVMELENQDIQFAFTGNEEEIPSIMQFLMGQGFLISEFKATEKTMEDLFIELTKGEVQ